MLRLLHLLTHSLYPYILSYLLSLFLFFLQKPKKQRGQSGYLLFSHEMRASIRKDHPEYAFGEISRIIGVEVISTELCNLLQPLKPLISVLTNLCWICFPVSGVTSVHRRKQNMKLELKCSYPKVMLR